MFNVWSQQQQEVTLKAFLHFPTFLWANKTEENKANLKKEQRLRKLTAMKILVCCAIEINFLVEKESFREWMFDREREIDGYKELYIGQISRAVS